MRAGRLNWMLCPGCWLHDRLQTPEPSTNDPLRVYGVLVDLCSSNPRPDSVCELGIVIVSDLRP
jgi:hypothetical protein